MVDIVMRELPTSFLVRAHVIRVTGRNKEPQGLVGEHAQVLIQGEDHLFKADWTYGHGPYPPKE